MSESHVLQRTLTCEHTIKDPGHLGNIIVDRDLAVVEIVSADTEIRTISAPTTAGVFCTIRLATDGGDVTVYFPGSLDASANTNAAFDDAGDYLHVVSVSDPSGTYDYRWQLLVNSGTTLG